MPPKRSRVTFRVEGRQYEIYAPPGFVATWRKFQEICARDRQTTGDLIRVYVEGQVRNRDPGNPQRPISAWVPGHPDQAALEEQELLKMLKAFAEHRGGEIRHKDVVETLRDAGVPPARRVAMADDLSRRLSKDGVKVLR